MDFYTKEWKEYIYENWQVGLPIKFYITQKEFLYDNRKLKNSEDYKNLINSEYAKFCNNRKKYITSYRELENKFLKYEKINVPNNLEEEYHNYFLKVNKLSNKIKNNTLNAISKLKENNINFNLKLKNEDFTLIALNKVTLKIKMFYENLKDKMKEIEKDCFDVDYIECDINAFLTSYDKYLNSLDDKFDYNLLNEIGFHDSYIKKCECEGENIILEIFDNFNDKKIKMTLINCNLITNINLINRYITFCEYGNYEDYKYYILFSIVSDSFINENAQLIADKVIVDVE